MKSAAYLDAYVLACPVREAGLSTFSAYVENLISWTELRQADWIRVYLSRSASFALAESNAYPPHTELTHTIDALGIRHIQAKDVVGLINGFLLKSSIIEDELGIDEFLFDDFHLEPPLPLEQRRESFPFHFRLLSVLLCLHRHFMSDISNQVLITAEDSEHTGATMVRATITDLLSMSSEKATDNIQTPLPVAVEFYLCRCLHSLHTCLDACSIWSNAHCEYALKKAIEIHAYQSQQRQGPYKSPVPHSSYSIGSHFVESCRNLGFFDDVTKIQKLLRACSETVLGTDMKATHRIRTSAGANSPQLEKGDASAWRRDIDREYHLHYWSGADGPRLANVVQHNDLSILEG